MGSVLLNILIFIIMERTAGIFDIKIQTNCAEYQSQYKKKYEEQNNWDYASIRLGGRIAKQRFLGFC